MFKLLYFCMAGGILLFSVIVVNIAPAINNLDDIQEWSQESCKHLADQIKYYKDRGTSDESLDPLRRSKTRCERRQAMVGLEFAALNCNLVFGFICALLGFFLFFNIGNVGKIASFAGLGAGIVGFVLTFVYVIESGLVFNDIAILADVIPRIDSDGVWAEWDGSKYKCKYFKEKKTESFNVRYSDFGNKFLRYNKDIQFGEKYDIMKQCRSHDDDYCTNGARKTYRDDITKNCDKLYYYEDTNDNYYKIIYDRWLTTIILSCIIFILDIGLAVFGFLVNSGSKETGI